jgi:hypothetical protein
MLRVITAASAVLVLAATAAGACEYGNTKTTSTPVPAVTAQAPVQTPLPVAQTQPAPTQQDVAQAPTKPADIKTN